MTKYIAPPREASADRLIHLCEVLEMEKMEKKPLAAQAEGGKDAVYDTVRYGERLGFLQVDQEGVSITFLGRQARGGLDDSSRQTLFQTGLSFYTLYIDLLNRSVGISDLPDRVSREHLIDILNNEFGLEMSEKTTKERVHTFMRTLEEAGLGKFESGNQCRDTGFAFAAEADRLVLEVVSVSALDLVGEAPESGIETGPASNIMSNPTDQEEKQQTTLSGAAGGGRTGQGEEDEDNSEEADLDNSDEGAGVNDDEGGERRDELFFADN